MNTIEVKDLSVNNDLSADGANTIRGGLFTGGVSYFSIFDLITPYNPDPETGGYLARRYQDYLRRTRRGF